MGLRLIDIDRHEGKPPGVHLLHDPHILHGILLFLRQRVPPFFKFLYVVFQLFFPLAHQFIGKRCGADTEKSRVISQRMEDLIPGDPVRHHHVGRRVGFGEHIGDLLAGPDIPFRHVVLFHDLDPLVFKSFSLAHALHDRKRLAALHTLVDQIGHDIVAGTDRRGDRSFSLLDQHLGVAQPHICPVGQPGDPDQIGKTGGLGIQEHLDHELRPKLRDAQSSQRTPADILRRDPQGLRTGKQGHHIRLIQRDLLGIRPGQIFQHTDHGRIVVPQDIQLQQVAVDGMIVKMGGGDV